MDAALPEGCVGILDGGKEMQREDYPLYRTIKGNEVIRGEEFRIRRADGSYGSIRTTSSPMQVFAYLR